MALAKRNPITRVLKDLVHLGMESFGRYYSSYRGFVVDRDDPAKLGRLQLLIPQVTGTTPYKYWAIPKGVYSGKGYGSQVLPQKGDLVWVEFEGGCPEIPIWNHGYFGKNEMPNDEELKDPNTYWFKTPKGNLVLLNDTKNLIRIKTSLGDIVELNESSVSIVTKKQISLGTLNKSDQKAVLGDKQLDALLSFVDTLKSATVLTELGPQKLDPNTQQALSILKRTLKKTLSNKVTLD